MYRTTVYVNKGQTYSYTVASAPATTKLGFDAGIQITVGTTYTVCMFILLNDKIISSDVCEDKKLNYIPGL